MNNEQQDIDFNSSTELITFIARYQSKEVIIENISINQRFVEGNLVEYITNHFEEINSVEINIIDKNEFTKEVVSSLYEYLQNAIPQIEKLSESFYLSPSNNEWRSLYDLLEGLHFISTAVHTFTTEKTGDLLITPSEYDELLNSIRELSKGIEQKDTVLIADVLTYEIKDQFEKLQIKLQKFLKVEAEKNEAN